MNILYIHQYFKTPKEPGGTRSYWIAQELIKNGHEVTMITTRAEQLLKVIVENIDGIRVVSFRVRYSQNMSILQRLKAFTDFMLLATREGLKYSSIDLVIATSTPLTVGYSALRIKRKLKVPFIFEVRDLWPEVPIQMGAITNPLLKKAARYFEKIIYQNATHIITLSPGMRDGVIKYVPKAKTSMIPNMAKKDEFWPREKDAALERQLGLSSTSFKVIHFGALGLANGIETIIETASLMKEDLTVQFVFLGGGSMEDQLRKHCRDLGLDNVIFLPRTPMKETSEIVNFCDVSLVSFKDLPILYTNSPNKLFDSLSAGKPIIVNSAGWTKDLVEEYECGAYVNPNYPEELKKIIKDFQSNPEKLALMSKNARMLAESRFDKTILCKQFVKIVDEHTP